MTTANESSRISSLGKGEESSIENEGLGNSTVANIAVSLSISTAESDTDPKPVGIFKTEFV